MIKLDVTNGVYTVDMDLPLIKEVQLSGGHTAFNKPVTPSALCRGRKIVEKTGNWKKLKETELNGVGEGEDGMQDERRRWKN